MRSDDQFGGAVFLFVCFVFLIGAVGDTFLCFHIEIYGGGSVLEVIRKGALCNTRLTVDKHKTRLQRSNTIIMQHFLDYSP